MSSSERTLFPYVPAVVVNEHDESVVIDDDVSSVTYPQTTPAPDAASFADATKATSSRGDITTTREKMLIDLDDGVPSFSSTPATTVIVPNGDDIASSVVVDQKHGIGPTDACDPEVAGALPTWTLRSSPVGAGGQKHVVADAAKVRRDRTFSSSNGEAEADEHSPTLDFKDQVGSTNMLLQDYESSQPQSDAYYPVVFTGSNGAQVSLGQTVPLHEDTKESQSNDKRAQIISKQQTGSPSSPLKQSKVNENGNASDIDWMNQAVNMQQRWISAEIKLEQANRSNRRRQCCCILSILAIVLTLFILTGVGVSVFFYCREAGRCGRSSDKPPTTPTATTTTSRATAISAYIQSLTRNDDAPDPDALQWLVSKDNSTTETQWRQRYALATLGLQLTRAPTCDWPGVGCRGGDVVTRVDMQNARLTGPLPTDLSLLTELTSLRLGGNRLTGGIPSAYGDFLTHLDILELFGNMLTGQIPSSLGRATGLYRLNLSSNQLDGTLPTTLNKLTRLNTLALELNQELSGSIPQDFAVFSNLQYGYFFGTRLVGSLQIPCHARRNELVVNCELVSCACCTHCCPRGSRTDKPTHSMCKEDEQGLSRTSYIIDYINKLRSPASPMQYPLSSTRDSSFEERALAWVIDSDPVQASTPRQVLQRYVLAILRMPQWLVGTHECKWDGVKCSAPNNNNNTIISISLDNTRVPSGSIPRDISLLTDLQVLRFFRCNLIGTIPSELGRLSNLKGLQLEENYLTGSIPISIWGLKKVGYLGLYANELRGTIPTDIGQLTHLTGLSLSDNDISGTIPNEILNCPIEYAYFHNLRLLGTMPLCNRMEVFNDLVADCHILRCSCCSYCCTSGGYDEIPEYAPDDGWCH